MCGQGRTFRNSGHHRLLHKPNLGRWPTGKTLTEGISSGSIMFSKKDTFFMTTAIFIYCFSRCCRESTGVFLKRPHWVGIGKVS